MGGRHGAALFCVANCDFGFAANCAGAANCASTRMVQSLLCKILTSQFSIHLHNQNNLHEQLKENERFSPHQCQSVTFF